MNTLWLLQYNNYYNRIVKQEEDLSGYQGYQVKYKGQTTDANGNTAVIQEVNFIAGDFVNTTQVVNWGGDHPDYLLVIDEYQNIESRWFIVDAVKTRMGQLELTLHRDLVVDFYSSVTNPLASFFVEKAHLSEFNNLIFNSENMTYNQIKTSETIIKDASECPWLCIYASSKDAEGNISTFNIETDIENVSVPISRTFNSMAEFNQWSVKIAADQNKYITEDLPTLQYVMVRTYSSNATNIFANYYIYNNGNPAYSETRIPGYDYGFVLQNPSATEVESAISPQWESIRQAIPNYYDTLIPNLLYDPTVYDILSEAQNTFVKVNDVGGPKYYKIVIGSTNGYQVEFNPWTESSSGVIYSAIKPALEKIYYNINNLEGQKVIAYGITVSNAKLPYIEDVTKSIRSFTANITTNRFHLIDAPYDMFCIPYSDTLRIKNSLEPNFVEITASKQLAIDIARAFITKYSQAGAVYDAQILPYCPIPSTTVSKEGDVVTMDLMDYTLGKLYTSIRSNDIPLGYILHASLSSFSRQIKLENPIVIKDYKVESECDIYRLCSPNYNGIFEFNAAKNGGVSVINIQCTYKPFTPYIKLYPEWGRLYGENFGEDNFDARGLICGGDFSLPATTSAWETYELQNKNYQNSFDRQIQNMEINNSVQREMEKWSIASGAIGAGVQGASTGLMVGGPIGALIGGVIGAGASTAAGLKDLQLNDKLMSETIDYTKDQFGYQLGNIKALPQSLSKVSAYNVDNKYFPFLEYYTCSEIEKQALRDKIKYNGMTVMVIGSMKQYIDGYQGEDPMYFKGKLIRLPDFNEDYHVLEALANEIYKGVFLP